MSRSGQFAPSSARTYVKTASAADSVARGCRGANTTVNHGDATRPGTTVGMNEQPPTDPIEDPKPPGPDDPQPVPTDHPQVDGQDDPDEMPNVPYQQRPNPSQEPDEDMPLAQDSVV